MPSGVMEPGQTPGESEFSFGPGMVPHPDRSVAGLNNQPINPMTNDAVLHQLWAERRTDPTDSTSEADFFVEGNPDRFGGQPPLVRESGTLPPSNFDPLAPGGVAGAVPKTGVTRES